MRPGKLLLTVFIGLIVVFAIQHTQTHQQIATQLVVLPAR